METGNKKSQVGRQSTWLLVFSGLRESGGIKERFINSCFWIHSMLEEAIPRAFKEASRVCLIIRQMMCQKSRYTFCKEKVLNLGNKFEQFG